MPKRSKIQGWDGGQGYDESANRDSLVDLTNTNCTPGLSTRKSLPTRKFGSRDMDRDSPREAPMTVPNQRRGEYLDSDDER
jgi:hypothetical protein